MLRIYGAGVLLAVSLSACGTGRLLSYGGQLSDARVSLGAAEFQIYVHPKDDTLLIQRSMSQVAGEDGPGVAQAAARQFLAPVDCTAGSAQSIAAGSFEVSYQCARGVDLRQLVTDQRPALRQGAALKAGNP